jgi:hypothetical protein
MQRLQVRVAATRSLDCKSASSVKRTSHPPPPRPLTSSHRPFRLRYACRYWEGFGFAQGSLVYSSINVRINSCMRFLSDKTTRRCKGFGREVMATSLAAPAFLEVRATEVVGLEVGCGLSYGGGRSWLYITLATRRFTLGDLSNVLRGGVGRSPI